MNVILSRSNYVYSLRSSVSLQLYSLSGGEFRMRIVSSSNWQVNVIHTHVCETCMFLQQIQCQRQNAPPGNLFHSQKLLQKKFLISVTSTVLSDLGTSFLSRSTVPLLLALRSFLAWHHTLSMGLSSNELGMKMQI